jgi:hypothetical protein
MKQSFGEWYEKQGHLYLARHRVSESSSAKYGPGKDFALCVNWNCWNITVSVQMGLPSSVVLYVKQLFEWEFHLHHSYTEENISHLVSPCNIWEISGK